MIKSLIVKLLSVCAAAVIVFSRYVKLLQLSHAVCVSGKDFYWK